MLRRGPILRLVLALALVLGPLHPWATMALAQGPGAAEICSAGAIAAHHAGDAGPAPGRLQPCLDCIVAGTALLAVRAPMAGFVPQKARRLGRALRRRPPALRRVRRPAARDPPPDSIRS